MRRRIAAGRSLARIKRNLRLATRQFSDVAKLEPMS
jgi:hypothetical protein